MIRLDHNRALTQLATKAKVQVSEIEKLVGDIRSKADVKVNLPEAPAPTAPAPSAAPDAAPAK